MSKIQLYGFNNLTKSLSFSLYKLHYLVDKHACEHYPTHIQQHYSATQLSTLLIDICHAIGGNVLNIASQDYQPQGASVTIMISEEAQPEPLPTNQPISNNKITPESVVAHLDKSHLCVHTYPEESPQNDIAIFRADIELSTCGVISPLKVLNFVISSFEADVIDIDYRVRGMTRNSQGKQLFIDEKIENISDSLSAKVKANYKVANHNLTSHNLFHSKLAKTEMALEDYLFEYQVENLTTQQQIDIKDKIDRVMTQLFNALQ